MNLLLERAVNSGLGEEQAFQSSWHTSYYRHRLPLCWHTTRTRSEKLSCLLPSSFDSPLLYPCQITIDIMSAATVPVAAALSDVYPPSALSTQGPRWNALLEKFKAEFGHSAEFVARSPGRVNIIGEHIDYSLYACLPTAITADALLAVSASPAKADDVFRIRVRNVQDDKFAPGEFTIPVDGEVEIDSTTFDWTNYFKSGLRGALGALRQKKGSFKPVDMDIVMDGNVPVGGGLSSSAAFTTASALSVMVANGEANVSKQELTELAIVSERAVGVNSGGYVVSPSYPVRL